VTWAWDPRSFRYRDIDTGRFMPRGDVLNYVDESIHAGGVASNLLGGYAADGTLSPADFRALFREELKGEYIREYLLGIGGREQMGQPDWGSIGGMLADQYRYLDGLIAELEAGTLSPEQLAARIDMYINSAREAFERAHGRVAEKAGCDEELWSLNGGEHCPDCLEYAGMGWQPIGTFPIPGSGQTQ
jgi:hypothetical protein